jgi:hypothetical protein
MDWMNWKTWTAAAVIIIAVFAIYSFAASDSGPSGSVVTSSPSDRLESGEDSPAPTPGRPAPDVLPAPGVQPVRTDLLEAVSGSYKSERNIFAYREPPPPPPPPPPAPPPPPPDQDKDGVPDFRDNCVSMPNPDQSDIDRDGIGTTCETEAEVPPPPPPPVPPQFDWKFIGVFGSAQNPLATFVRGDEILNVRVGDVIEGKFILRGIGIESAEIAFVGFPADIRQRIPLGQQ